MAAPFSSPPLSEFLHFRFPVSKFQLSPSSIAFREGGSAFIAQPSTSNCHLPSSLKSFAAVSIFARAGPPRRPPSRPSATAAGFLVCLFDLPILYKLL